MIENNVFEVELPYDFRGYLNQLVEALLKAKETGDISFAEKAYEMVIDDIKGIKTYAPSTFNSDRLSEALQKTKRLF